MTLLAEWPLYAHGGFIAEMIMARVFELKRKKTF